MSGASTWSLVGWESTPILSGPTTTTGGWSPIRAASKKEIVRVQIPGASKWPDHRRAGLAGRLPWRYPAFRRRPALASAYARSGARRCGARSDA